MPLWQLYTGLLAAYLVAGFFVAVAAECCTERYVEPGMPAFYWFVILVCWPLVAPALLGAAMYALGQRLRARVNRRFLEARDSAKRLGGSL